MTAKLFDASSKYFILFLQAFLFLHYWFSNPLGMSSPASNSFVAMRALTSPGKTERHAADLVSICHG